jgi:2-polyprenyl-3-methyl-5-hydroxy-6-metoxy-1,4-benzoquinol methylase
VERSRHCGGICAVTAKYVLVTFAEEELKRAADGRVLDIACGAGRNALPLARLGWNVVGTDSS